jgi:hypothetical protein
MHTDVLENVIDAKQWKYITKHAAAYSKALKEAVIVEAVDAANR